MRVVLDANILLAGYGFGSVCYEVIERCLIRHHIFLAEHILLEFHQN